MISFSLEGRKMTCFICYSSGRENLWNLKASDACLSSPACPLHQGTLPSHLECTSSGCSLSLPRLYSRKAVSHSLCWLVERGKLLSRCWLKGPRSRCSAFQFKFSGALIAIHRGPVSRPRERMLQPNTRIVFLSPCVGILNYITLPWRLWTSDV